MDSPVVIEKITDNLRHADVYRIKINICGYVVCGEIDLQMGTSRETTCRILESEVHGLMREYAQKFFHQVLNEGGGQPDNSRYRETQELYNRQLRSAAQQQGLLGYAQGAQQMVNLQQQAMSMLYGMAVQRSSFTQFTNGEPVKRSLDRDKKAMKLLSSKIGWRKTRQLKKKGYFEEQSKHGIVRFHMNTQGGVSLVEEKKYGSTTRKIEWDLCVQSKASDLPKGDVILSRWMEWRQDEDKFLDTANFRAVHTRDEATQGRG